MGDTVYQLDDLILAPDIIKESKVYRRARVKADHEIELPTEEREILLREIQQLPEFKRMAKGLVEVYFTPDRDYLSQNFYETQYRNHNYTLPWLVPIVTDKKLVYKKKYVDSRTELREPADLLRALNGFVNYANFDQPQLLVESIHNYLADHSVGSGEVGEAGEAGIAGGISVRNRCGGQVLRVRSKVENPEDLVDGKVSEKLEFRGSYGDQKGVSLVERQKTANRNIIVGYDTYDQVIGEPLQVIGFAEFPRQFPSLKHEKWSSHIKISLGGSSGMNSIVREALPEVAIVLERENLTGVTDFRAILRVLEEYGHPIQSLTVSNRKTIASIIETNLSLWKPETYTRTTRLEYPMLEKELISEKGSGILEKNILEMRAMRTYGIDFLKFPHLFSKYLKIMRQLDNGNIWLSLISGKSKKEIEEKELDFRIVGEYLERESNLQNSYFNLISRTVPNQDLYEDLTENPLDNIQESRAERRDAIAWNRYFKQAYVARNGIDYVWHGKRIGCVHEYDRLFQMFEDSDDSFPYGKKWTEITPFNGIICGFCGDTIVEEDELISQGYDARGQRINTYDNEGLVKQTTNVDMYFQEKTEVVKTAEKMVDLWIEISEQGQINDRAVRALKYQLIKPFEEMIRQGDFRSGLQQNPNKMMKVTNRAMGQFLIQKYQIANVERFPTFWFFREKIFPFFYSLFAVYEIVIQRLSIFMVILNWHLIREDSQYLNPNVLLRMFTQEGVGKYFFLYQLNQRVAFQSLKSEKKDSIQDGFVESAMKIVPRTQKGTEGPGKKMGATEYQEKLAGMYLEGKRSFLYTPNHQGQIFNGDNPLEHEVVEILSAYLVSLGKPGVMAHLEQLYHEFWKTWSDRHQSEVRLLEEQSRVSMMGKASLLHKVESGDRPMFDRYLAQHRVYKLQQLEQVYLDLVNDEIHKIQVSPVTRSAGSGQSGSGRQQQVGGHSFCPPTRKVIAYSETVFRKMIVLNRLNCEDWSAIQDLDLVGLESETQRMNAIMTLKSDVAGLERQIAAGGTLVRPYLPHEIGSLGGLPSRSRKYDLYKVFAKFSKDDMLPKGRSGYRKMIWAKNFSEPEPVGVKDKKLAKLDDLLSRLKFLVGTKLRAGVKISSYGDLEKMIKGLGSIEYYPEAEKWSRHYHAVTSGMMSGTSRCNDPEELTPEERNDFELQFQTYNQNMYLPQKARLANLKKYILTYVRQRIYRLELIKDRETLVSHGFELMMELFNYNDFNAAFAEFNGGRDVDETSLPSDEYGDYFSNQEIDEMVLISLADDSTASDREKTIDILVRVFLCDLIRQLEKVRTKAGRFQGKQARKVDTEKMNAGQIFEGFVRILMGEIYETERIANVNFHHRSINEQIRGRMIFQKYDKAEKKSPIDYMIARFQVHAEDDFDEKMDDTGGYMVGDETKGGDDLEDFVPENDNDADDVDEIEFTD